MTSLKAINSVFNKTDENKFFSDSIPGRWGIPNYLVDEKFDELKILLLNRYHNDIELHLQDVRKRGDKIKINCKDFFFSDFDTLDIEILEELKSIFYHDLEG